MVPKNKSDEAFQELATFLFELYKKRKQELATQEATDY
jgi:hypothetical protein